MSCPDAQDLLDLVEGDPDAATRERITAHLDECASCREIVADLARAPSGGERAAEVVLDDRFELGERVGRGGMGTVHRGVDRTTNAPVAIKLLSLAMDSARFTREWELLRALDHPAIVRYVAHGKTLLGADYLVTEWLEGETLGARLEREGKLSVGATLSLGIVLAGALAKLHRSGVIHRDLKPANVFLVGGELERAKVLDFGLARLTESPTASSSVTRTGAILGTPGFMAPEQARSEEELDERVDVFSLGCVLYRCLTGSPPFAGGDLLTVLLNTIVAPRADLERSLGGAPAALRELLLSMLAASKEERPRDGEAVVAALEAIEQSISGSTLARVLDVTPARASEKPTIEQSLGITPIRASDAKAPAPRRITPIRAAIAIAAAAAFALLGRYSATRQPPLEPAAAASVASAEAPVAVRAAGPSPSSDGVASDALSAAPDVSSTAPADSSKAGVRKGPAPVPLRPFDRRYANFEMDGRIRQLPFICRPDGKPATGSVAITFSRNGQALQTVVSLQSPDPGFADCARGVFGGVHVPAFDDLPVTVDRGFAVLPGDPRAGLPAP